MPYTGDSLPPSSARPAVQPVALRPQMIPDSLAMAELRNLVRIMSMAVNNSTAWIKAMTRANDFIVACDAASLPARLEFTHYLDTNPEPTYVPSQKEQFEAWAKFKCPQFNPAGRYVAGGKWAYHHNIQQLLWECWQDKPDAPAIPEPMFVPGPDRVMHTVLDYQMNLRSNVTGTTNWAANIGMAVVKLIEQMNPKHKPRRV